MPDAGPSAVAESDAGGTGDDAATYIADSPEGAPEAATDAVAANPETTDARVGLKQQLLAACQAAEHWLQAERDRPGETRPDDILRVLRAAIARAEGQPRPPRQAHEPGRQRQPREGSKESQVIAMLRRPEGATLTQIGESTGVNQYLASPKLRKFGLELMDRPAYAFMCSSQFANTRATQLAPIGIAGGARVVAASRSSRRRLQRGRHR
jgi:hypothetical protein